MVISYGDILGDCYSRGELWSNEDRGDEFGDVVGLATCPPPNLLLEAYVSTCCWVAGKGRDAPLLGGSCFPSSQVLMPIGRLRRVVERY